MGWAVALDDVVEPADIWHGMWAGSLPALARMRRRHGGRTIYDSRDIFMHSRKFARLGRPGRNLLEWAERRWARGADRVLTVNDAYAELLEEQLRVPRPAVVMNCREIWTPPSPRPDLIREALGLPAETAVVLYQGILTIERGIEQSMDAILEVPSAVLVLMGFGPLEEQFTDAGRRGRRTSVASCSCPPVPPDDLLALERLGRRPGHGHPADDAEPSIHDAAEAVREHRGRRPGRRLGSARDGADRPGERAPASCATRRRRRASRRRSRRS